MKTVYCDTTDAVFQFQASDVIEHLKNTLNAFDGDATSKLVKMICTNSQESIEILEEQLFGYVALSQVEQGKGAVTCKACNRIYKANQVKSFEPGAGKSPLHVKIEPERGILNLFQRTKRRNPQWSMAKVLNAPTVTG